MRAIFRSRGARLPLTRSIKRGPRRLGFRDQSNTNHSRQPQSQPPLKVFWDSECPLCTREISLMKKLDSEERISFIPITKDTSIDSISASIGASSTCPVDKKTLLARFHAQEEGKGMVDGAAAFAAMWRQIPRLRWLGNAARNSVVLWVLERAYRGFLVVRPNLQWIARRVDR